MLPPARLRINGSAHYYCRRGEATPSGAARPARVVDGVPQQGTGGVGPGRWSGPQDAFPHVDLPAGVGVVGGDADVVPDAEQSEVVQVRGSALGPGDDVVGLASIGGDGAAGGDPAPGASGQGPPLRRGGQEAVLALAGGRLGGVLVVSIGRRLVTGGRPDTAGVGVGVGVGAAAAG